MSESIGAQAAKDAFWQLAEAHEAVPRPAPPTLRARVHEFVTASEPGCRHGGDDVPLVGWLSDPTCQVWCSPCALYRVAIYGVAPTRCDVCGDPFDGPHSAVITSTGRLSVIAATCSPCSLN